MPPKTKKTTETTVAPVTGDSLDKLKEEWLSTVKKINDITEQLDVLAKQRDEIVSKIWEHMNKNQTELTTPEDKNPQETVKTKSAVKKTTKSEVIDDDKPVAPKKPVKQEVDEEEKPVAAKKAPAKKTAAKEPVKETTKEPVKKVVKKVSAPAKGTPKPKLDDDDDGDKQLVHESSSETDLDSLSSVSESEGSDGEDN